MAALRYRDFRLLLLGVFLAMSGWWMMIIAQGWLVLELTDSASMVALVSAMMSVPFLFLGPFAGIAADRLYRKHLLVTTRFIVAVVMFLEGFLILAGWIEVWHMLTLGFVAGCAFAMDIPARQSLIPDTVPDSTVANAVALNVSVFSITTIAGPLVGAGLLAAVGAMGCFMANGVGNVALALLIAAMRIPRRERTSAFGLKDEFVGGLQHVRQTPLLILLLSAALVVTLAGRSWQQLAPVFVRDVFGAGEAALGWLYTAAGVGAVMGALMLVGLSRTPRRAPIYLGALLAAFVAVIGFAWSPSLLVASAFVLVAGFGLQVSEASAQTAILVETPEAVRGRVMSLWGLLWGLQPLGTLMTGVVADLANPHIAVGGGAVLALLALAMLFSAQRDTLSRF
ncbi:MAG: MFS transporter [Dehalococcoidia bacterium]|nr:MFS transporter [Dehalococcoidia bacterium]